MLYNLPRYFVVYIAHLIMLGNKNQRGRHGLLIYLIWSDNENLVGHHLGKQSLIRRRGGDEKITLRFVL
jgi:hypothetical protein